MITWRACAESPVRVRPTFRRALDRWRNRKASPVAGPQSSPTPGISCVPATGRELRGRATGVTTGGADDALPSAGRVIEAEDGEVDGPILLPRSPHAAREPAARPIGRPGWTHPLVRENPLRAPGKDRLDCRSLPHREDGARAGENFLNQHALKYANAQGRTGLLRSNSLLLPPITYQARRQRMISIVSLGISPTSERKRTKDSDLFRHDLDKRPGFQNRATEVTVAVCNSHRINSYSMADRNSENRSDVLRRFL